jgi:uncharacterized protein YbjT (DUF2867 family)
MRAFIHFLRVFLVFIIGNTTLHAVEENVQTSSVREETSEVMQANHYLIFGATSGVGLELAKLLVARGDKVTAFVRPTSNLTELKALNVEFVTGDALNRQQVDTAFAKASYKAVVTTMGCFKCPTPPDYEGNKNVFDAARASNSKRVLMISTLGAGDTYDAIPWISKRLLKDVIALKDKAEKDLMSGGLDYTILRPGALKDLPPTGTGVMAEKVDSTGIIGRADVAALLVKCIDDDATIGKTYAVFDKEMSWPWDMIFK